MIKKILFIAMISMCFIGCGYKRQATPRKFSKGQTVYIKANGSKVTVLKYYQSGFGNIDDPWEYKCRIYTLAQKKRDDWISADTQIVAYTKVDFSEYELVATKEECSLD